MQIECNHLAKELKCFTGECSTFARNIILYFLHHHVRSLVVRICSAEEIKIKQV